MADGTFAVLTIVLGLLDMRGNYCPQGACLARNDVPVSNSLSLGKVQFQDKFIGEEIYLRRNTGTAFGPFQGIWGLSVTDTGDTWAGIGAAWTKTTANERAYVQLHTMAGAYAQGSGPDLGGPLEFRSGVELGLQARNGARYGISYDHRSNAGIYSSNLGLETFALRVTIPVK